MSHVYLAGPISGRTYEDAQGWRVHFASLLADGIVPLGPMRNEPVLQTERKLCDFHENTLMSSRRAVLAKCFFDVMRSNIVVANLLGAKTVSIGTVAELAWAYMVRARIVVVMEPTGNPHDHGFIREMADWVVDRLEDAADVVNGLLVPGA